ncbi:MAG TPA: DUF2189 domain-containing protein [Burkholderiaceae bacterium]|jgi:uncharacterized membrane protein|nr:DUF2189 domain-containing protein [Burkholderiaceae bacterium]
MAQALDEARFAEAPPEIEVRRVGLLRPLAWLAAGMSDLRRRPGASLGTGALVALAGALLVAAGWKATYLAPAMLGGFLLVAPFLAIGLYGISRAIEQPRSPAHAWRTNAGSVALFGLMLAVAYLFWERTAAIVFALNYRGEPLHLARLPLELMAPQYRVLLLSLIAVGAALALVVFMFSVVSVPLLVDRRVDVITAGLTSLRCCTRNPGAMALWAALIVALTALGFATLMIGLVLVFPWLAHASWHAYRDLVRCED